MSKDPSSRFERFFRPIFLARVFFILIAVMIAALIGWDRQSDYYIDLTRVQLTVFAAAVLFVIFEYAVASIPSEKVLTGTLGCLVGLIFARFFYPTIPPDLLEPEIALLTCNLAFGYFGTVIALRHMDWLRPGNLKFFFINPMQRPKILDSSVLIDGRIVDMVELGLVNGPVIVPEFVIHEIQMIADSSETHRRTRGRRGLDVLERLRNQCKMFDIFDGDFPEVAEVDQKLVQACKTLGAELLTNDFNLKKIAELHQIHVISLNEVADAMRPTVYVGEMMKLSIVKTGKEPGQGVGYLGDGTMVVVEESEGLVGHDIEVIVNNILQNPTGRLVFARRPDAPPASRRLEEARS